MGKVTLSSENDIKQLLKSWSLTNYIPDKNRIRATKNRISSYELRAKFEEWINQYLKNPKFIPEESKPVKKRIQKVPMYSNRELLKEYKKNSFIEKYKKNSTIIKSEQDAVKEKLRTLGYGSYLSSASFVNVDNIVRMARLKAQYEKVLKMLLSYFKENKLIYNYIRDKYIATFVREQLSYRHSLNSDEAFLVSVIKNSGGELPVRTQKKSAFKYLNDNIYVIKWEDVRFRKGEYTILPPVDGSIKFGPHTVYDKLSDTSLNYIRDFIQEKIPNATCTVNMGKLTIDAEIDLGIAIRILESPMYKPIIQKRMTSGVRPGFIFPSEPMSFSDSMSKARSMSKEDFERYKSKFVSFLLKKHIPTYKVIPCKESIAHAGAAPIIENAFIFTLPSSRNCVILAVENLNPDRATLLFRVSLAKYEDALMRVHSFLKSDKINKRSTLREDSTMLSVLGTYDFAAVNHRDEGPFTWRSTMEYRLRTL